jgi:transcriptional regulator with XRE-family HTH domain
MLADVPSTERLLSIGARRGSRLVRETGEEIRHARLTLGISQSRVGEVAGVSKATISRLELGQRPYPDLLLLSSVARIVGLDLSVRCFPAASRLRDAAHAKLIERFLERIPNSVARKLEAPIRGDDQRAWDVLLRIGGRTAGVAAESRLRDLQELLRRERQKQLDSKVTYLYLLLAATRHNRAALAQAGSLLSTEFPVPMRRVMPRLVAGEDPGGDAVIIL